MQQGVEQRLDPPDLPEPPKTTTGNNRELEKYEGGASRTPKLRYDLVPPEAVDAIARRITLGASIHGERNWEKGGPAFYQATLGHLLDHVLRAMQGDTTDDHLDAIICNAAFLVTLRRRKQA